jgi:FkbM family methyltransferase
MEIDYKKVFIEIGSCDFDTNIDLINNGNWIGVMCEPAPKYRNNLMNLVKGIPNRESLTIEPLAISDYNGKISFGVSKDTSEGSRSNGFWRRGISSVLAESHKGERVFDIEQNQEFLEEAIEVDCMTLDSLIAKHEFAHVNYLKIDVEGHELNILECYSWDIKPDIIKVEHAHVDDVYISNLLKSHGYLVYVEHEDIYAIR